MLSTAYNMEPVRSPRRICPQ